MDIQLRRSRRLAGLAPEYTSFEQNSFDDKDNQNTNTNGSYKDEVLNAAIVFLGVAGTTIFLATML